MKHPAPQVSFLHQAMDTIHCLVFLFLFQKTLLQSAVFFIVISRPGSVFSCKISIMREFWLTSLALFPKPWRTSLYPA